MSVKKVYLKNKKTSKSYNVRIRVRKRDSLISNGILQVLL